MPPKAARAAVAVASHFDLPALPFELQLCVAAAVASPRDRAALSLALPPLGLAAARGLAALYKGFDMGVAMTLVGDALPVDEALNTNDLPEPALCLSSITVP